ncbi:L-idonate 5-dehydrogenase, partial [Octadecabacter sp.]|nr:L-idonate 5-dehydrogenase [Octadecabacter sp.]
MRAVVIHAAQDLRIEEQSPLPAPATGKVRINMAIGGICGSDLHYYNHGG